MNWTSLPMRSDEEDQLERESEKKKVPSKDETVFESRSAERKENPTWSELERFSDSVLPSRDEAEEAEDRSAEVWVDVKKRV